MAAEMDMFITSFSSALKDMFKFKIVSYVNTGDKTQDNLLITVLLAIMTILFAAFSKQKIIIWYYSFKRKIIASSWTLNKSNTIYYKTIAPSIKDDLIRVTWDTNSSDGELFTKKILSYCMNNNIGCKESCNYDFKTKKLVHVYNNNGYSTLALLNNCFRDDEYYPIFINKNGVVYILKENSKILLAYNHNETLALFLNMIENIQLENSNESKDCKSVYDNAGNNIGSIYPDRTFDLFVSKYKPAILEAIDVDISKL